MPELTAEVLAGMPLGQQVRLWSRLAVLPTAVTTTLASVSREDPAAFIREVLGERPSAAALEAGLQDPWTPDQGRVLEAVRDHRRVAVPSGRSSGKSYIVARIALWFLYHRPGSLVVTTARNQRQVETVLWGEIREAHRASKTPLPGRLLPVEPRLIVEGRWMAIGFTASPSVGDISATAFQGLHGPRVMVVLDEAAGIDEQILAAA